MGLIPPSRVRIPLSPPLRRSNLLISKAIFLNMPCLPPVAIPGDALPRGWPDQASSPLPLPPGNSRSLSGFAIYWRSLKVRIRYGPARCFKLLVARSVIRGLLLMAVILAIALAGGCSSASKQEDGVASWYGSKHHGKKTASGQPFNQNALTAAHPHLPFGTQVRVTNLANGKQVVVSINDRGPYKGGRIIDLSRAAARKLEMDGIARVRVEVLSD